MARTGKPAGSEGRTSRRLHIRAAHVRRQPTACRRALHDSTSTEEVLAARGPVSRLGVPRGRRNARLAGRRGAPMQHRAKCAAPGRESSMRFRRRSLQRVAAQAPFAGWG